jgi:hypothetical protein
MKNKIYFDSIDRQIIIADNSLYASRMKLHIAVKKFEREFSRFYRNSWVYKGSEKIFEYLT